MGLAGSCRRRVSYRCCRDRCQRRFTLKREPKKEPKCPYCGHLNVRNEQKNIARAHEKRETCRCHELPFPHEKGTFAGCVHWEGEWTEERERIHQEVWSMPRGFHNPST